MDEQNSVHFAGESTFNGVTIQGNDARFQPLISAEDYTKVSWVHIQEDPSALDTMIWKIEHSGTLTCYLKYGAVTSFTLCVSPKSDENVSNSVFPSTSPPNLWWLAIIRI